MIEKRGTYRGLHLRFKRSRESGELIKIEEQKERNVKKRGVKDMNLQEIGLVIN